MKMDAYKNRRAEEIYHQIYIILCELVRNSSNYSEFLVRQMQGLVDLIEEKKPRRYPKPSRSEAGVVVKEEK
jgi:hypothetical protein